MSTKMVCCLKHMTYKERLKELGFLRLVKRMLIVEWTLITFFGYLKGGGIDIKKMRPNYSQTCLVKGQIIVSHKLQQG